MLLSRGWCVTFTMSEVMLFSLFFLLTYFWRCIVVDHIYVNLPGTIGLPFQDVQPAFLFVFWRHVRVKAIAINLPRTIGLFFQYCQIFTNKINCLTTCLGS